MITFHSTFDTSFSSSTTSTSSDVPAIYDVALGGHGYMIDWESDQTGLRGLFFRRASVPVAREQADQGNIPDEGSLNRDDLWRRTFSSWHKGSGQTYADRAASDADRFHTSLGVNPWNRWQLTCLNDTTSALAMTGILHLISAGSNVYAHDGTALKFSTNLTAWTTVTGTPATIVDVCTDGTNVYVLGADGKVYNGTVGGASVAAGTSVFTSPSRIAFVKGRLMVAGANAVWNPTAVPVNGALPTNLVASINGSLNVTAFAEVGGWTMAAVSAGDRSYVYRTAITSDGTALGAMSVAGELPAGETCTALLGYLGLLILGTTKGLRLASVDSGGSLTLGPLVATSSSVLTLSPFDRFVWFGWTNYDGTHTGLGRADLSVFTTSALMPAYATDLMYAGQGSVVGACQFAGSQVFAVSGVGVIKTSANLVAGSVTSGFITYDLVDPKVAMYLDVGIEPLPASCSLASALAADAGSAVNVGNLTTTGSVGPTSAFPVGQVIGDRFEVTHTLTPSGANGPTLYRWTLRSFASPPRPSQWVLPLVVQDTISPLADRDIHMEVQSEIDYLFSLLTARQTVNLQIGQSSYNVFITDVEQLPFQGTVDPRRESLQSTVVVSATQAIA